MSMLVLVSEKDLFNIPSNEFQVSNRLIKWLLGVFQAWKRSGRSSRNENLFNRGGIVGGESRRPEKISKGRLLLERRNCVEKTGRKHRTTDRIARNSRG